MAAPDPATAEPPAAVDYQRLRFAYRGSADQDAAAPVRHPVVVVGAGPVGLSLAIDLAQRGVPVLLLDNDGQLSTGSRAICFAKRTLEIFDRLGVGDRMVAKGVRWNVGRVFFRSQEVYRFDLLPETGHERPAFINLQQYYVEGFLAERAAELPLIDLRWHHAVSGVTPLAAGGVQLTVDTPEGPYTLLADHLVACDGSRSTVRRMLGLESQGRSFRDRFLIADVRMKQPQPQQPAERWFWFDPPFHPGQSVLLHMQPDGVWRIDFQLGWDADPEQEKRPERILPRVRALLAHSAMKDAEFELEWASVYTFACQRMAHFRHGSVFFAGDSAHGVSPFGARGANSGIQDAENLAWKLAAHLQGRGGDALLDSYASEREQAADENILHSTRATDFITPKSEVSRLFRDAVLQLASTHPFARTLVNSGRLSVPATLHGSPLNSAVESAPPAACRMVPGAAAADAPLRSARGERTWLLRLLGAQFTLLRYGAVEDPVDGTMAPTLQCLHVHPADDPEHLPPGHWRDEHGLLAQRYAVQPGDAVLLRPDQHVAARWSTAELARQPGCVSAAVQRACALA